MRVEPVTCDILVIDDDDGIRAVLLELLQDEGYMVEGALHGRDGLRQLRGGLRPSLILLDWRMPVMSGAQFRSAQHDDPQLAEIPVAVISAHAFDAWGETVDADAFLRKPFNFADLLATVAQFCPT